MNIPSFLNKIQLTQCYHCFDWCHKRNACPHITEPVTCSRCSGSGHNYLECELPLKCVNCDQTHAATYKGCPTHQTALNTVLNEIQNHFNQSNNNNSATTPQSTDLDTNSIMRAARLASKTPQEFAIELFAAATILVSPPNTDQTDTEPNNLITDPVATRLTFGCESEEMAESDIESLNDTIIENTPTESEPTPTKSEPPADMSLNSHNNKITELREKLESIEFDFNNWAKDQRITFMEAEWRPEDAELVTISTNAKDKSLSIHNPKFGSGPLTFTNDITHIKLGEWSHYIELSLRSPKRILKSYRLKIYDHLQDRSPDDAKIILDHLTTTLDFPLYQ